MKIKSSAFGNGEGIPDRYTQYHDNRSLPLEITEVPPAAASLALIMDDPDAPRGAFTHWIVFNIDPNTNGFRDNHIPKDVKLGTNDAGMAAYAGPKPPDGEHRYFLHLYALATRLDLPNGIRRSELEKAMAGHVIGEAELMGRYATPVNAL